MFDFNGPFPPKAREDLKKVMLKLDMVCPECGSDLILMYTDNVDEEFECLECGYQEWKRIKRIEQW